jgi:hypothetical protein
MSQAVFRTPQTVIHNQDVLELYAQWPTPDMIMSDGGYGVSGFNGDAHSPQKLQKWYEQHIQAWSQYSRPGTTLWFWNTEIGWANVHTLLVKSGWDYVCCNIWDKGLQHIAGNCNLATLKHFPIVTEVCVQYVRRPEFEVRGKTLSLKQWIRHEWDRSELPLYRANEACGVANAASRKYLTKDHLWYAPPPEHFASLVEYANQNGKPNGRPYFSIDGENPLSRENYAHMFAKFDGEYGVTNVWQHPPLHTQERIRVDGSSKYAHLNQKPVELIRLLIETSTRDNDIIWEPFGGLCTAGYVAQLTNRRAFCAEIDKKVYEYAVRRLTSQNWPLNQKFHKNNGEVVQYAFNL